MVKLCYDSEYLYNKLDEAEEENGLRFCRKSSDNR
jgi:hypothetical protein